MRNTVILKDLQGLLFGLQSVISTLLNYNVRKALLEVILDLLLNPYSICATACDWKISLSIVLMPVLATGNSSGSKVKIYHC